MRPTKTPSIASRPLHGVAFSPDGTSIASAGHDLKVRVWDVETGEEVRVISGGHTGTVECVAFSPDGLSLATGSFDKTVRLWSAADFSELAVLRGHGDVVWAVDYSPCGTICKTMPLLLLLAVVSVASDTSVASCGRICSLRCCFYCLWFGCSSKSNDKGACICIFRSRLFL